MNTSDKFYLKKGKLELSMLEDEEDIEMTFESSEKKNTFDDLEFAHTKRRRESQKTLSQPKLKVSKEVYNTLHMMGQFLTKQDSDYVLGEGKRSGGSTKSQKLQKIASSIKVQEVELPPAPSREALLKKLSISKYDQIKQVDEEVHLTSSKKKIISDISIKEPSSNQTYKPQTQAKVLEDYIAEKMEKVQSVSLEEQEQGRQEELQELQQEQQRQQEELQELQQEQQGQQREQQEQVDVNQIEAYMSEDVYRPILEGDTILTASELENLNQEHIDDILKEFFKGKPSKTYPYARELKNHIEKQIQAIRNYQ